METQNGFTYSLHVNGMFGRNRKTKFECIELKDAPEIEIPNDELAHIALAKLGEIKAKPGCQWRVVAYPTEFKAEQDSHGSPYTSKIIAITSGVTVIKDEVR